MSTSGSGWSDERVEKLKSLWAEGLSASQIAAELGGVSRNAVIGKVHRLKLSGRSAKSGSAKHQRKPAAQKSAPAGFPSVKAPFRTGNLALAFSPEIDAETDIEPLSETGDVLPMARYLTLLELDACSCRWPIGDPRSEDFRFCGAPTQPGDIYCAACSRKAFQPKESRTRRS